MSNEPNEPSEKKPSYDPLTPVQGPLPARESNMIEHYLKKDLLSKQIAKEISNLSSPTALSRFGDPFIPLDPSKPITPQNTDFPFLRFVFVNFVQSFPFLHDDQRPLWQDKVQPVFSLRCGLMIVSTVICREEYFE
jgi:PX-associated